MATVSTSNTIYWWNGGWTSGTYGRNDGGYLSTKSNGRITIQPITVTPTSGFTLTSFSFTFGVVLGAGGKGTATGTLYAQAYTTLDNAKAAGSTGAIGNQGSVSVSTTISGAMHTMTISGLNITSATTIYVTLWTEDQYHKNKYLQYWIKTSGNVTSYPTGSTVTNGEYKAISISYNANGGSGAPSATTGYQYTSGGNTSITISSTKPTKSGYTFMGWGTSTTDTSVNYNSGQTYNFTDSKTIYAIWRKTITITYNVNGGTGGPTSASTGYMYNAASSVSITISSTKPTRSGYTFMGWGTSTTDTSVNYNSGTAYNFSASATIYAIWRKAITITYSLPAGASGGPSPLVQTHYIYNANTSASVTIPGDKPIQNGFIFAGWSTTGFSGPVTHNAGANYSFSASTTLYAVMNTSTHTVTIVNGSYGTVVSGSTIIASGSKVAHGTVLTISPTSVTGYTTTAKPTGSYTVTSNVTITFTRTGKKYYIYYKNGLATSGTLPADQTRTYPASSTIGTNNMSKSAGEENSYTVTYAHGTNTSGTLPSKQTSKNKLTYAKNGWTTGSTNVNDRDYANGARYSSASNLTLYPNFTRTVANQGVTLATNNLTKTSVTNATYTVTFNANGGSVSPTSASASKITTYGANGWTTTKDSATKNYNNGAATGALSGNLTLYPCFSASTNTGSVTLPTPSRTGHSFSGWYTAASGGSRVGGGGSSYTPSSTVTLYAQWGAINYTATFDANGGSGPSPSSITKPYNSGLGTLPTTSRNGYTFKGWYTATSGGTKISTSTKLTKDVTYYAQWTANKIKITFNKNGGTGGTNAIWYYYNSPTYYSNEACTTQITEIVNPTKTGHTFVHYHGDGTCGGLSGERYVSYYNGSTYVKIAGDLHTDIYKDATLYASWSTNEYTVYFDANGGSSVTPPSISGDYGNALGTLPTATRLGYSLNGWYTAASGGTKISSSTTITGNATYYAHWDPQGAVRLWNNSSWPRAQVYIWDGSTWRLTIPYVWDGSTWRMSGG